MIAAPGIAPRRVGAHVSLVDLLPTFLDLATRGSPPEPVDPLDGATLVPLMNGEERGEKRTAISEYSSEGVCAASRMVRAGRHKYVYTRGLDAMLFDLERDPDELRNLAGTREAQPMEESLRARALAGWDPDAVHERILASQKRRLFLAGVAQRSGRYPNWAYQPFVDESKRFVRGAGLAGPTGAKAKARFPFVEPAQPDRQSREGEK
jgi:choline-sulfatase